MDDDSYIPFEGTPRPLTPEKIAAIRRAAEKQLEGHVSVLSSLTPDQQRAIVEMDEPAVMCGRVDQARARRHRR